jgi:uncharacterized membrane protein YhaH (DUF805 family)
MGTDVGWYAVSALLFIVYVVIVSLPGIAIAYLGWKVSRRWHPASLQTLFRAVLIAVTVTPSIYGHGAIVPAILLAILADGKNKMIGIIPMLVVLVVAILVIYIRGKKRAGFQTGSTPD